MSGSKAEKASSINKISASVVNARAKPTRCKVKPVGEGEVEVEMLEPIKWVTPGQAAVFYRDDLVLGGGFINRMVEGSGAK